MAKTDATAVPDPKGFDPTKAKEFLKKLVPIAKIIATFTPTPVDDMIVGILEAWLADPSKIPAAMAAAKE